MKKQTMAVMAVCAMMTVPMLAQQTGTSHPPEAMVEDTPAPVVVIPPPPAPKPSPAVAAAPASQTPELKVRPAPLAAASNDLDANVVTEVPAGPNELPRGAVLRVRLGESIATDKTKEGTTLLFQVAEDVVRDGRVMIPAGSSLSAQVTDVRGGKRIHGAALVHIEPRELVMKDGSRLPIHAMLIDTDKFEDTRVDSEGNLIRKDHVGGTLAAMSLSTGGAAAAGGVIGGVPGALVGAAIGASASTIWWLKQDRQMHVDSGATMVFQLTSPLFVHSETSAGGQ